MLEIIQVIFHFLKCYQKNNPLKSCFVTILFSLIFLSLIQFETRETTDIVDKNMDSILQINRGGNKNVPESNNFVLQTPTGEKKKFDLILHRELEQHFPDWEERIDYQKKQEQNYKLAMKKKNQLKRLRIKENSKFYTDEELDSISYFQGTGFYQEYQNLESKPNIFDTRQTFLFKMHDPLKQDDFLDTFILNNK